MFFSNNIFHLGKGKVTSARSDEGSIKFLVAVEGAVVLRSLNKNRQLAKDNVISYCDECYFAGEDIIERRGNSLGYVSKN